MKNAKVDNELINSIKVKLPDDIVNIKSPYDDERVSDYWTINQYKTKNIQNVDVKDR